MSFFLAYYRLLYPKVRHDETNVFLYYIGGMDRFYDASQISRAEDRLGLSTKVGSTTAYQAYTPRNLLIRQNYWTAEYPVGMIGIRRRDIIDIDEFGAFVEKFNRNSGKAMVGRRVREEGPYNHSTHLNVMMAISGEEATAAHDASRWLMMWTNGGTDVDRFLEFIELILDDIGPGTPGNRRCFTMDNLISHK